MQNKKLDTALNYLPGFIHKLKAVDPQFGKIKPNMMKTTFPFNEYLRVTLKNAIAKCRQSMSEKMTNTVAVEADEEDLELEHGSSDEEEAVEESDEADDHEEPEDEAEDQDARPIVRVNEAKMTKTPKVSPMSKRITKEESIANMKSHLQKNPGQWQSIAYLQETIKGREFELRMMRKKLEKKYAKLGQTSKTPSPDLSDIATMEDIMKQ